MNKNGKIIIPYITHTQYEDVKVPEWCSIYSEENYGTEMFFHLDEENQWWYVDLDTIRGTYGQTKWKLIFGFDESSYTLKNGSYQCYDGDGESTAGALLNVDINIGTIHAYVNNIYNANYIEVFLTFEDISSGGEDPSPGDFIYSINPDSQTITITGYEGSGGEVTIPSVLDGYNVETIGENAFANCSTLTAVTFPESVSVIETGAFYNCVNLSTCKFLNSGVTIEDVSWTFFGCENLTNIYLYRYSTAAVYFPYDEYTLHYLDDAVYYVYYDANGGNDAPSRQSFAEGEGIWLSDTEPTRAGYDFLGWSTDYEADGVEYYPGEYYELTGNLYLYAVWEAAEVKYNNTEFYFSEDVSDISSYSVTPPAGATQEYPLGGSTTIIDIGWYTIEATAEKDIVAWQILFDDKEYIIRSENSYESGSCKLNYESDGTLSIWLQGFTSPRITISALTEYNPSGGSSVPSSGKYRVLINGVPAKWKGSDGNYYYMYVEWKNN